MRNGTWWLSLLAAGTVLAGCSGPAPKQEPQPAPKVEAVKAPAPVAKPAPAPVAKPAPAPVPAPAADPAAKPVDRKPVAVDLSKCAFPTENATNFGWNDDKLFWYSNGTISATVEVPADGEYQVVVSASCDEALGEKAKFKLLVDGEPVGAETALTATDAKDYTIAAPLKAGARKLGLQFTNDKYKESEYDLNLYVHALTLKRVK